MAAIVVSASSWWRGDEEGRGERLKGASELKSRPRDGNGTICRDWGYRGIANGGKMNALNSMRCQP